MTPVEGALKIISLVKTDLATRDGNPSRKYMLKVLDDIEEVLTK